MSDRLQIGLLFLAPVALLAGLYALGLSIPVPSLGRGYVVKLQLPSAGELRDLPEILGPEDNSRPLVVIDAGHGGPDGGASASGYVEKDIVLGLALALRDRLLEDGGVRVALTRSDDSFVVLQERVAVAQKLGADVFVSIHADSAANVDATGATIYTLDDEASDAVAARFAERENAADTLNGVQLGTRGEAVDSILVDLSQRRVKGDSLRLARLVLREGEGRIRFHPAPLRAADLAVLKSLEMPSILFESGYITNAADAERLASAANRRATSDAIARALRIYLATEQVEGS